MAYTSELSEKMTQKTERSVPLWLVMIIGSLLLLNGLPFLAPVFMKIGWEEPANLIYFLYKGLCHQMAQRSFFLFGPQGFEMYNLADLPGYRETLSSSEIILTMRRFTGNSALGWKVAWSDRMVYMYVAPLLVAIAYAIVRQHRQITPLPLWAFFILLLPMMIDGGTHWLSDLAGIGHGFRYTNDWLIPLTGGRFSPSFYAGDAFGSFNSWMRLLSGITFGIALGGILFPEIDQSLRSTPETHHKSMISSVSPES